MGAGVRPVAWVRTQRAGSSPGVRTRLEVRLGWGGGSPPGEPAAVSARTRSAAPVPATIHTRSSAAASRTRSAMSGAASAVDVAVASARLSANKRIGLGGPFGSFLCSCVLDGHEAAHDESDEQEQDEVEHLASGRRRRR